MKPRCRILVQERSGAKARKALGLKMPNFGDHGVRNFGVGSLQEGNLGEGRA